MRMRTPTEEMAETSALLMLRSRVDSSKPAEEMTADEKIEEMQRFARRMGRRDPVANDLQTYESVRNAIVKRISELVGRPVSVTEIALKWKKLIWEVAKKGLADGDSGNPDEHLARAHSRTEALLQQRQEADAQEN